MNFKVDVITKLGCLQQCRRIATYWYGSGSVDPYLWLMDPTLYPASGPAIFVSDLQDANHKLIFLQVFLLVTFWRFASLFRSFFKDKKS